MSQACHTNRTSVVCLTSGEAPSCWDIKGGDTVCACVSVELRVRVPRAQPRGPAHGLGGDEQRYG